MGSEFDRNGGQMTVINNGLHMKQNRWPIEMHLLILCLGNGRTHLSWEKRKVTVRNDQSELTRLIIVLHSKQMNAQASQRQKEQPSWPAS